MSDKNYVLFLAGVLNESSYMDLITESKIEPKEFKIQDLNSTAQSWLYNIFKESYMTSTGSAFTESEFFSRASGWTFFGVPPSMENDPNAGFVAVRFQKSGLVKLTGIAGSNTMQGKLAIFDGIRMLHKKDKPIWGAVSADLAKAAGKMGFKVVPSSMFTHLSKAGVKIPGMQVDDQGNLKANIQGIGEVEKVAIVNDLYLQWLKKEYPNLDIPDDLSKLADKMDKAAEAGEDPIGAIASDVIYPYIEKFLTEFILNKIDPYVKRMNLNQAEVTELVTMLVKMISNMLKNHFKLPIDMAQLTPMIKSGKVSPDELRPMINDMVTKVIVVELDNIIKIKNLDKDKVSQLVGTVVNKIGTIFTDTVKPAMP